nr:uncharacterized protein LOC109147304 [Ipomoea batatas]GMD16107.1 uncharacterized protein LOC109147304 [Ipomoea batatas]
MVSKFKRKRTSTGKPTCIHEETWRIWEAYWDRPDVKAKSEQQQKNRMSEVAGPDVINFPLGIQLLGPFGQVFYFEFTTLVGFVGDNLTTRGYGGFDFIATATPVSLTSSFPILASSATILCTLSPKARTISQRSGFFQPLQAKIS